MTPRSEAAAPEPDEQVPPLRRVSLADQAVEGILRLIAERGLQPGDTIPPEGELAATFGVNRLVVREAVRTLVAREVLRSGQGKPAVVTVPSAQVVSQVLQFRLHHQVLDHDEVIEARRILEGSLVRQAALRHDEPRSAAHLRNAARELEQARLTMDDRAAFVAHDVRFHAEIARASGNSLLCLFLDALEQLLVEFREQSYVGRRSRGESHESTLAAHEELLRAVHSGSPEAAAAAMDRHLTSTVDDLRSTGRANGGGLAGLLRARLAEAPLAAHRAGD